MPRWLGTRERCELHGRCGAVAVGLHSAKALLLVVLYRGEPITTASGSSALTAGVKPGNVTILGIARVWVVRGSMENIR